MGKKIRAWKNFSLFHHSGFAWHRLLRHALYREKSYLHDKYLRMYEKKIPENLECGISVCMKVMGGKWKAWIIECINDGIKRPSEIHRQMETEGASLRVITMHLKELEDLGVLYKKIYPGTPLKVEYYLTEVGMSTLPLIKAMSAWGKEKKPLLVAAAGTAYFATN
jgi:DNA-binding HxlR family transcriptional regulator